MSLRPPKSKSPTPESTPENAIHTVESALTLLHSLREQIYDLLRTAKLPLSIRFSRLDIMQPPRGTTKGDAHVLWTGPMEMSGGGEENKILHNVCNLVHQAFRSSGFIVEDRPLKLHCTLVNTGKRKVVADPSASNMGFPKPDRKNKGKGRRRIAFSYDAVRASKVLKTVAVEPISESDDSSWRSGNPSPSLRVEFGSYPLLSLEICEMGSYDERGGYKSVGGISLLPPNRNNS